MRFTLVVIGIFFLAGAFGCSETAPSAVAIGEALGVEGQARLQGISEDGHSGIRVEVRVGISIGITLD